MPAPVRSSRTLPTGRVLALWAVPWILFSALRWPQVHGERPELELTRFLATGGVAWLFWVPVTLGILAFVRHRPLGAAGGGQRLLIFAAHVLVVACFVLLQALLWNLERGRPGLENLGQLYVSHLNTGGLASALLLALIWFVTSSLVSRQEARVQAEEATRLGRQLAEARLETLRAQLRPHFLFNALNTVSSFVRQGEQEQATDVLARLAGVLRSVLRSEQQVWVRLADEVALALDYLEVERARLGERLEVRVDLPPSLADARVPALVLQPLVENAVRHGIATVTVPCTLTLRAARSADRLRIEVDNEGAHLRASAPGVGLRNARGRLAALYGEQASLELSGRELGGACARLDLPLTWSSVTDEVPA